MFAAGWSTTARLFPTRARAWPFTSWSAGEALHGRLAPPAVLRASFFAAAFLLAFNLAAEYYFFYEFGVRYNFIAVDYLVYTNEVLGNIRVL